MTMHSANVRHSARQNNRQRVTGIRRANWSQATHLSLPGSQPGDPTHDAACRGLAESRSRHAQALVHAALAFTVASVIAQNALAERSIEA
jgi:hypothetical protein